MSSTTSNYLSSRLTRVGPSCFGVLRTSVPTPCLTTLTGFHAGDRTALSDDHRFMSLWLFLIIPGQNQLRYPVSGKDLLEWVSVLMSSQFLAVVFDMRSLSYSVLRDSSP